MAAHTTSNESSDLSCTDTVSDLTETVQSLEQRLTTVESELSEVREERDQLEDENEELRERVNELEQQVNENTEQIRENTDSVDDHDRRFDALSKWKSHVNEELESFEDHLSDHDPTPSDEREPTQNADTPLETLVSLPEHVADKELTANQERARFIAKDVSDYGRSVPAGWAVKSSDIRKAISAKEDGSTIHQQTVTRIIEFLDDLGDEDTEVVKRRGTKRVVFTEESVERYFRAKQRDVKPVTMSVTG